MNKVVEYLSFKSSTRKGITKWYWTVRDIRGCVAGESKRGFSTKQAAKKNATVVALGIKLGSAQGA